MQSRNFIKPYVKILIFNTLTNKWICASFVLDLYVSFFFPGRNVWSLHQLSFLLLFDLGLHDIQNTKDLQLSKWSKEPTHISKSISSLFFFFYYFSFFRILSKLMFLYIVILCIFNSMLLYTYYISSLRMLIHIVNYCIREKTS